MMKCQYLLNTDRI